MTGSEGVWLTARGRLRDLIGHPWAFVVIMAGLFFVGLYPFDFFAENPVSILPSGYSFDGTGMVLGEPMFPASGGFSLEMVLTPGAGATCHLARILSLVDPGGREVLSLSQWGSFIELGTTRGGKTGMRDALHRGRQVFLTLVCAGGQGTLLIDGRPGLPFAVGELKGMSSPVRMILGNSPGGKNGWTGKIEGLSAPHPPSMPFSPADRDRRFRFWSQKGVLPSGNLAWTVPRTFRPLKPAILEAPWGSGFRLDRSFISDTLVNLLGFVPLGLGLSALLAPYPEPGMSCRSRWPRRLERLRVPFLVIGAGFLASLAIEILQVYLPSRNSSLNDLALNTAGTALGLLLFRLLYPRDPLSVP